MQPTNIKGDITAEQALKAVEVWGCKWLMFDEGASNLRALLGKNAITLTATSELSNEHLGGQDAFFFERTPYPDEVWGVTSRVRDLILGTNTEEQIINDPRLQQLIGRLIGKMDEIYKDEYETNIKSDLHN